MVAFRIPKREVVAAPTEAPAPEVVVPPAAPPPQAFALRAWALKRSWATWPLEKRDYVIGRLNEMAKIDLAFSKDAPNVSRKHARLCWRVDRHGVGAFYVKDLESLHGTFVNRYRLGYNEERELHHGDVLWLGRACSMVFSDQGAQLLSEAKGPMAFRVAVARKAAQHEEAMATASASDCDSAPEDAAEARDEPWVEPWVQQPNEPWVQQQLSQLPARGDPPGVQVRLAAAREKQQSQQQQQQPWQQPPPHPSSQPPHPPQPPSQPSAQRAAAREEAPPLVERLRALADEATALRDRLSLIHADLARAQPRTGTLLAARASVQSACAQLAGLERNLPALAAAAAVGSAEEGAQQRRAQRTVHAARELSLFILSRLQLCLQRAQPRRPSTERAGGAHGDRVRPRSRSPSPRRPPRSRSRSRSAGRGGRYAQRPPHWAALSSRSPSPRRPRPRSRSRSADRRRSPPPSRAASASRSPPAGRFRPPRPLSPRQRPHSPARRSRTRSRSRSGSPSRPAKWRAGPLGRHADPDRSQSPLAPAAARRSSSPPAPAARKGVQSAIWAAANRKGAAANGEAAQADEGPAARAHPASPPLPAGRVGSPSGSLGPRR